jgi:hypothetical protein
MSKEVLKIRKYKVGYEIRTILYSGEEAGGGEPFEIKSAYTPEGYYIGRSRFANFLCKKHGIKPELSDPEHNVCSIGFSEREQKWYGWSHRAIYGFGIGYVAKEGDCCTEAGVLPEFLTPENDKRVPVGFEVKTLEDAKRCAIAFAESVS